MLSLASPRWADLRHAYGAADDVPAMLTRLEQSPWADGSAQPWSSIWSALAHQGDVYSATFAAVPHIVAIIELEPARVSADFFHFPAWVEICRLNGRVPVPESLEAAYLHAVARLPALAAQVSEAGRARDEDMLVCLLASLAAANGAPTVAQAVLELDAAVAERFLKWHLS